MNPQQLRLLLNLLNQLSAARDLGQTQVNRLTQSQQNSNVQNWAIICSDIVGAAVGGSYAFGTEGIGALNAFYVGLAAAQASTVFCPHLSQSTLNFFNSNASALQSDLYNAGSSYATTPSQQAQLDALNSATSSGDFAGALAAANQLAVDSNFLGTPSSNGDIAFQLDGATITLGSTWQPASLVIDSADGTSQVVNYGSDGSNTTTTYTGPDGTGSATEVDQENADNTSQITIYNSDGSNTTTHYTGPNGTGSITEVDQENANGTSQITVYNSDGSSTSTTYSGPNGTGPITKIDIESSTSSIVQNISEITYDYSGTGLSGTVVYYPTSAAIGSVQVGAVTLNGGGYTFTDFNGGELAFNPNGQITGWGIAGYLYASAGSPSYGSAQIGYNLFSISSPIEEYSCGERPDRNR